MYMAIKLAPACSAAALTIAALIPQISFADAFYTFIGDNYTTITDSPAAPGTYTTAMNITGSLELASALPASFSGVVTPLAFSFTDGRTVFSNPLPGTPISNQFTLTTNSAANIQDWNIQLAFSSGATTFSLLSSTGVGNASITNPGGADTGGIIKVVTGIWVNLVPEPSTYAMMVAGLGLIGFAAHRGKQKAV